MFTVKVTEDFLDYLDYGTLSVELYGHRQTGLTNEQRNLAVDEQHKSFSDRCAVLVSSIVYWVMSIICNVLWDYCW